MRKMYVSQTLSATGTGTDETTRWTALAQNAAREIKAVLDAELTGFQSLGLSYIGGENYETQLIYHNTALGYDLVVGVRGKNKRFGIVYYLRYNGRELVSSTTTYDASASRSSGNTVEEDFRVAVYDIDDIIWFVGIERYTVEYNTYGSDFYRTGTFHISVTAFKGSYDGETYVMYRTQDDYSTKIENVTMPLPVYAQGDSTFGMYAIRASDGAKNVSYSNIYGNQTYGHEFVSYARTGSMPAPKTGYFLYPYCWYGTFVNADGNATTNFGLALFNGNKVLYDLRDAATNLRVTTEPRSVYTVNGKSYLAVSSFGLIISADPPLKKLQKPGEVLTW